MKAHSEDLLGTLFGEYVCDFLKTIFGSSFESKEVSLSGT